MESVDNSSVPKKHGVELELETKHRDAILETGLSDNLLINAAGLVIEVGSFSTFLKSACLSELKGLHIRELFPDLLLDDLSLQNVFIQREDGSKVHARAAVVPASDSCTRIILQDTTELVETRNRLDSFEKFWETTRNAIPDLVIVKDPDGRWKESNLAAEKKAVFGKLTDSGVPVLSPDCTASDALAWKSSSYVRSDEKLADGNVYDVIKIPFRNPDETPRSLLVIARDVTERRIYEERIVWLNNIVKALRSIDKLIRDSDDINSLCRKACEALTDSEEFSICSIFLENDEDKIIRCVCSEFPYSIELNGLFPGNNEFASAPVLSSGELAAGNSRWRYGPGSVLPGSMLVSPLRYQDYCFGFILALPLENRLSGSGSELREIFAEVAGDIGYAIHGRHLSVERAKSSLQVIHTKNMLDAFLENLPGPAFIRDSGSRYLRMNKLFGDYFGETSWLNGDPEAIYDADIYNSLIKTDKIVLEKGYVCRLRMVPDKNGKEHSLEVHYFRIEQSEGEPLIGGIGLDITDRLKTETALAESEDRYRTIYENTTTAMGIIDINGVVISINTHGEILSGYTREEIIGKKTWVDFVHPDDIEAVTEQRKKRLAGEASDYLDYEFRFVKKDGSIRNIRMRTGTIPHSQEGVLSLADVTDLLENQKKLNHSLEKTRAILEAIPDLMFVLARDGSYREFYAKDESMLAFPAGIITESSILALNLPEIAAAEILHAISETIDLGTVHTVEYELDLPDGHHYYEAGMSPYQGDTVLVLCRDVTRRKVAEAEQMSLTAQIQHVQKLESLGVLAGGIAHDFNNILMVITGNASLARITLKESGDTDKYLRAIETASSRASDLAGQMLAYSGRGEFKTVPLSLNTIAGEITDILHAAVTKKAVMLFDLYEDIPLILADVTQVRQVLMNLVTNASEALDDAPGTITVSTGVMYCNHLYINKLSRVEELPAGNYAYIEVKDNGSGMTGEITGKIFNPFFTTKFAGRGLGLSAVLGIMSAHSGAIEIQSEPGKGSTFRAFFPVMADRVFYPPLTPEMQSDAWETGGTVLLVDDEPLIRSVGEAIINAIGFKVISAEDGLDCVKKFKENISEVDVVILDITMPNMDGDEAFREIKKLKSDIPVIISSGYNEYEVIARFSGMLPEGFLKKPYNVCELRDKIRVVLKR
jgi:two-component system cell cycle sensor histidine kinase/response regulator CckA